MSKIIIEIKDNGKSIVTYDNDKRIIPICDIDKNSYHISEVTDTMYFKPVSEAIYRYGLILKYQLIRQGFTNKPLNKPSDKK